MAVRRVVVAVSPRLLGDALCRSLTADGLEVSSVDSGNPNVEEYDVAVVSTGREAEVRARHVLPVNEDGSGPGALSSLALLRQTLAMLT